MHGQRMIAEGIPERKERELAALSKKLGKTIIGPATVGGMTAGAFKIGNTAGTIDNIKTSRLFKQGSVGLVSKSGGMINELFNIVSRNTDGVYEGIAIGGDRYPGSTFIDHVLRFEANPDVRMIVLLGEVGGVDEYEVGDMIDWINVTVRNNNVTAFEANITLTVLDYNGNPVTWGPNSTQTFALSCGVGSSLRFGRRIVEKWSKRIFVAWLKKAARRRSKRSGWSRKISASGKRSKSGCSVALD